MTAPAKPSRWSGLLSPKSLIAGLITLILVVGELQFGVLGGYERLVTALGCAMLAEALFSWLLLGRRPVSLLSAYITGNSVALLVKPQVGLLWPFALCSVLSIASKYALRYRGRHLWNPSNFGIVALLLLAAPKVAVLSHEWGNALFTDLVIWIIGLVVVARARMLHVSISYVLAFIALAWVRSLTTGGGFLTEFAPLSGPMYQLFVFFMITDPPTTLSTRKGRIVVAILIAVVEALLRGANDLGLAWAAPFAPVPAFAALFLVGPAASVWQRMFLPSRPPAAAPA